MNEFKKYRRSQIAEIREVMESDIDSFEARNTIFVIADDHRCEVSISNEDLKNGSPKIGDMIARNPKNHKDQWLISEQYFKDNFESIN